MRKVTHEVVPVGEGNVCSIEFNLLYRWHATLSDEDTKWTESMMERMLGGKKPGEAKIQDFKDHAKEAMEKLSLERVREWTFGEYVSLNLDLLSYRC